MWLAHALTLARIPLAIAIAFAYGRTPLVLVLLGIAALTDTADGNVARFMQRRGHTVPAIGGWLDPLADKVFAAIVLVAIAMHTGSWLVAALIGARELVLVPLVALYLATARGPRRALRADPIGKAATVAQLVAMAVAVALPARALPVAIATAAVGLASVVHYVRARRMHTPVTCNTSSSE